MTYFEDLDRRLREAGIKVWEDLSDGSTIARTPPACGSCLEKRIITGFVAPNAIECTCVMCGKKTTISKWLLITTRRDKYGEILGTNASVVGGPPSKRSRAKPAHKSV